MPATSVVPATIVGAVGRRSTTRMLAAIAAAAPDHEWPPLVVLLSRGDTRSLHGEPALSWSEALASLGSGGVVIVPFGDVRLREAALLSGARVVTFGVEPGADIRGEEIAASSTGTDMVVSTAGERQRMHLTVLGEHLAADALAAVAAATVAGVPMPIAVSAVESLESLGHGVMHAVRTADDVLVIDDSRSLAPESVVAALKSLAMFATEGRRSVAILGALDIPGAAAATSTAASEAYRDAHDRIGRLVVRLGIAKLVVVGNEARHIHNAAGLEGSWNGESVLVETAAEAYDRVRGDLGRGDVVLVKCRPAPDDAAGVAARLVSEVGLP